MLDILQVIRSHLHYLILEVFNAGLQLTRSLLPFVQLAVNGFLVLLYRAPSLEADRFLVFGRPVVLAAAVVVRVEALTIETGWSSFEDLLQGPSLDLLGQETDDVGDALLSIGNIRELLEIPVVFEAQEARNNISNEGEQFMPQLVLTLASNSYFC